MSDSQEAKDKRKSQSEANSKEQIINAFVKGETESDAHDDASAEKSFSNGGHAESELAGESNEQHDIDISANQTPVQADVVENGELLVFPLNDSSNEQSEIETGGNLNSCPCGPDAPSSDNASQNREPVVDQSDASQTQSSQENVDSEIAQDQNGNLQLDSKAAQDSNADNLESNADNLESNAYNLDSNVDNVDSSLQDEVSGMNADAEVEVQQLDSQQTEDFKVSEVADGNLQVNADDIEEAGDDAQETNYAESPACEEEAVIVDTDLINDEAEPKIDGQDEVDAPLEDNGDIQDQMAAESNFNKEDAVQEDAQQASDLDDAQQASDSEAQLMETQQSEEESAVDRDESGQGGLISSLTDEGQVEEELIQSQIGAEDSSAPLMTRNQ